MSALRSVAAVIPAVVTCAAVTVFATGLAAATPAIPKNLLLLDGTVAGDAVIVVGERGSILRSTDRGSTWQRADTPTHAALTGVTFAPDQPTLGWAVGHDALILSTSDGGSAWQVQHQGEDVQDSYLDVLAIDSRHLIAVGAYGLYASSHDGGKTWTRRKVLDEDLHLNRISRGPTGTLYLAGERGTLLRSADGGATWQPIATEYEGSFYGVLPLGPRTLLAHGLRGHVFRSTDDGATWERVSTPVPVLLAAAATLSNGVVMLAGNARELFVSLDRGQTIKPHPAPHTTAVAELVPLANDAVLTLGEAGAKVIDASAR